MRSFLNVILIILALPLTAVELTPPDKPVLFLVERGFNRGEHYHLWAPMRALGLPVVLASINGGAVPLKLNGARDDKQRDIDDSVAVASLPGVDAFSALAIPGGYSPGFLEQDAATRDFASHFLASGQPVAAVCHGPRLLMSAGALEGRVVAGLYTLADELPDLWVTTDRGAFMDRPLVIDDNLFTARFPGDMVTISQAFLQRLTGGTAVIPGGHDVLVLAAGLDPHRRWVGREVGNVLGYRFRLAQSTEELERYLGDEDRGAPAVIAVFPGGEELAAHAGLADLEAHSRIAVATEAAGFTSVGMDLPKENPHRDLYAWMEPLTTATRAAAAAAGEGADPAERVSAHVGLVLRDGFDESVALPLRTALQAKGLSVRIIADSEGWVRGQHGLPLPVDATVAELPGVVSADGWLILPGGVYPELNEKARQATQPEWVTGDLAERDAARQAMVLAHLDAGGRVLAIGLDSLRLGRGNERFAKQPFATTAQAQWSFGKGGARFSREAISQANPQVLTADGQPAVVTELVRRVMAAPDMLADLFQPLAE